MNKTAASVLASTAQGLLAAGLSVLPAWPGEKRPAINAKWDKYKSSLPGEDELNGWFRNPQEGICLICGKVSGNLEMIDFDFAGELFKPWCEKVHAITSDLLDKLVIETSQSAGWHVSYRSAGQVCGSRVLAQRKRQVSDDEISRKDAGKEVIILHGKEYLVRTDENGTKYILITLIETRGEGGLFLCAPTPGYELVQGEFASLPVITEDERELLLRCAWELNEYVPEVVDGPQLPVSNTPTDSSYRPGDDYNTRGDIRNVLSSHGWACVKDGDNQYWRRPGKNKGWSATFNGQYFYVFSSNAEPFEQNRAYAPFAVYTLLEHNGDFSAATQALANQGYGEETSTSAGVDISGIVARNQDAGQAHSALSDPGPLPDELLRVPGFVSEVMDYCLATAPYPNQVMAFCGALSLQAFLAGRRVRDPGDNRTNIYLLGLAHSAAGKDHPRKVNTRIAHQIGLADCLGDRFASGEGIQDALFVTPSMLFQTDEIDGMLQTINKAKDARHENIMGTLLTMYSASNSVFPMRRKAGKTSPGAIDQPCLVIFGTAIPNHYYEALSERMLTNGFFARMIILESGPRPQGQEPSIRDLPPRVLSAAKWWTDFRPGPGNLENWHPVPVVIEQNEQAKDVLVQTRQEAEAEYAKAEKKNDAVGTTVWGRVSEQTRKLALLYAISEDHRSPRISLAAAQWARRFVMHQTRRMLFMAHSHVADNPFDAECLKLMEKLRRVPNQTLAHSVLLKRMKSDARTFQEIISTLQQRGDIEIATMPRAGTPQRFYRLVQAQG